ncbi:MAG: FAD-dependent oxidoreductase [Pseudonocardia sp.]
MSRCTPVPLIVDVAVVGGGALGAATAWVLARRGTSVALVEEGGVRQVREAVRGTAWSDHPGWGDEAESTRTAAVGLWRALEAETGAMLLRRADVIAHGRRRDERRRDERCRPGPATLSPAEAARRFPGSFTGPVALHRGAGLQVHAGQAIAALTAAAAGHGTVLRHRAGPVSVLVDGDRVEVDTATGRVHARRAVVTTVLPDLGGPGTLELHVAPGCAGAPLVAHRHDELGLVRIAPCAGGHLAVGASGADAARLREYLRVWFPGRRADEAVAPGARSTGGGRVHVESCGPVVSVTTDAVGSVASPAWGRVLADAVAGAAGVPVPGTPGLAS